MTDTTPTGTPPTDEQTLAHLLEVIRTPTGRLITFGDIDNTLGPEAYAVIVTVFEAAQAANPVFRPAFIAMSVSGMLLDSPSRLGMLEALSQTGYGPDGKQPWPPAWVEGLKALAFTAAPRWRTLGRTTAPTLEILTAERAAAERERRIRDRAAAYAQLREDWIRVYSRGLQRLNSLAQDPSNDPPTLAQVFEAAWQS